jgi:hypothetical protein
VVILLLYINIKLLIRGKRVPFQPKPETEPPKTDVAGGRLQITNKGKAFSV